MFTSFGTLTDRLILCIFLAHIRSIFPGIWWMLTSLSSSLSVFIALDVSRRKDCFKCVSSDSVPRWLKFNFKLILFMKFSSVCDLDVNPFLLIPWSSFICKVLLGFLFGPLAVLCLWRKPLVWSDASLSLFWVYLIDIFIKSGSLKLLCFELSSDHSFAFLEFRKDIPMFSLPALSFVPAITKICNFL